MSFTTVEIGFGTGRYPFDGPDFGPLDFDDRAIDDEELRIQRCVTCGQYAPNVLCVACADLEFIYAVSPTNPADFVTDMANLGEMSDTMGGGDGDVPDSVGGEDGDVPDSIGGDDDEDESNDDDAESKGM